MKEASRIDYEQLEEKIKVDVKDKRILSLLAKNSRTPLTQIAKKVKLSRDAVDYRIKRLQRLGVIQRCIVNLNYDRLGYYVFHIFLLLDELNKTEQDKLIAYLKKHPNIFSIIEYSDRWDLELAIVAHDLVEFDSIVLDMSEKFPHVILEKDKAEIIRRYAVRYLPVLLPGKRELYEKITYERRKPVRVDKTDLMILRCLGENARMSTYEIARRAKVSEDTIGYRIKNLVKNEVIRDFTILVNLSLLHYHWYTFSMELKTLDKKSEKKFGEFLIQNKNILRAAKTLGGWDILLYVVVDNPREFHTIIKNVKNVFADSIRNYQTWVAYKEHIFKPVPEAICKD